MPPRIPSSTCRHGDSTEAEEDWEKASLGSAALDEDWAIVGGLVHRSQSASPSGWDHLSELDVTCGGLSGHSSGRNTPSSASSKCTFAERMCAGPFASRVRPHHRHKRKSCSLPLSSHSEERDANQVMNQSGTVPAPA
uniref:Uncharacterized protein n=1 Tax=Haptolina ericina TaxID=156174 RepID=A0A7S3C2A9_9EUKA